MDETTHVPSRAERLGSRYGALTVGVVAVAFIVASVAQIVVPLFELGAPPKGPPESCAAPVRALATGLDQATATAAAGRTESAARAAFDASLAITWAASADVERTCAATADGALAFASLMRLRRGQESLLRRRGSELAPLRDGLARRLGER